MSIIGENSICVDEISSKKVFSLTNFMSSTLMFCHKILLFGGKNLLDEDEEVELQYNQKELNYCKL